MVILPGVVLKKTPKNVFLVLKKTPKNGFLCVLKFYSDSEQNDDVSV
jgi:hypothetical protein